MTSNAPKDALKDIFRPEFLNRLDEILEFDSLNEKQIAEIVKLQLKDFAKRLAEQGFKLDVDDKALAQLAKDPWRGDKGDGEERRDIGISRRQTTGRMYFDLSARQRTTHDAESGIARRSPRTGPRTVPQKKNEKITPA